MKKKRIMPAHIVLPNGMWRFVKRGAKKAKRSIKAHSPKHKTTRRLSMTKKYHKRGRKSSGGSIMSGFFKPRGILGAALLGMGAAIIVEKFLPSMPIAKTAAAGIVGGIPGIGGMFLLNSMGSGTSNLANQFGIKLN